ncbi:hypothetical protein BJX64DRAFT_294283 [Aspergillus heterothallicus]
MASNGNVIDAGTKAVDDSMVEAMIWKLLSHGARHKRRNRRLLSCFVREIKGIAFEVLAGNTGRIDEASILQLARRCYQEASTAGGRLHCDHHLERHHQYRAGYADSKVTALDSPANTQPIRVLEMPAALSECQDVQQMFKTTAKLQKRWERFWSKVLLDCPGLVLFDPLPGSLFGSYDFQLDQIPRYLFRTFDHKSFGRTDEDIVSSTACEGQKPLSKFDIFSLDKNLAMSIVDRHMNPWAVKDYEKQPPDNFMSWTSSLLYAVQYTLYRRHHYGCSSEQIQICVVDTTKFPRGQFIHAKRLLHAYYKLVKGIDMRHSISTRLLVYIYQNGEYLSQGSFQHSHGSCVVSLANLEASGLYSLYPEFTAPGHQAKWGVTTAYFRKLWMDRGAAATRRELDTALSLAMACFPGFDVLEMAIIVLSFKRRLLNPAQNLNGAGMPGHTGHVEKDIPEWGRKPQEVRQYLAALNVLHPFGHLRSQTCGLASRCAGQRQALLDHALLQCFQVSKS